MDIKNKVEIRNDFLNALTNQLSKIEGSYNFDIASAAAILLEELYKELEYWKKQTFIDTATVDEYIDKHALLFGVTRRKATKASGKITIKGEPGYLVTSGTVVISRKGIKYKTLKQVYLDGKGDGETSIECVETEEIGNCAEGEIVIFEIDKTELYTVTNKSPITGGYKKESNELVIARAKEKVLMPAHSGNIADYIQWCKEVEGVGSVHVMPCWNGGGTVKVLISDYNQEVAQEELLRRVRERLAKEDGAPIGADVTVASFKEFAITVGGTVYLQPGYILKDVKKVIEADLRVALSQGTVGYIKGGQHIISLNLVERLVLNTQGVIDCSLTLNSGTQNVTFGEEYSPKLKAVNLSEN